MKRISINDNEKTFHEENVIKQIILNLNRYNNVFYILTKRAKRSYYLRLNINENNIIIERHEFDVIFYYAILKKMFYYDNVVK